MESSKTMKQVSPEGLRWFQDARFGMFIHWGLYSLLARGEWVMHHEGIPVSEYEALMHTFNPTKFNADEWVSIAADAGQKYIVITSRHHDGFSMYDTALSDYKVTSTPFGRDPLDELADACARRRDVKLRFYSSLLDWHHPAYRFRNESGLAWADYLEFLHGQVRELCTQFGEIACLWFDGDWPHQLLDEKNAYFAAGGSFEYETLYDMIHTLQLDAIIHNNRHGEPLPGEDVQGFEQDLPGQNTAGFNTTTISRLPMEVCMTINIEGLETGRVYRGHFNTVNRGHITNLPDGCVIEIPGYVDRTDINYPVVGDLLLACAATCSASVQVQQMGVEAAMNGDVTLLKQAMLHDPLVGAVCNPEEVWQMTDEMLVAQGEWLPQFAAEVPAANARLRQAENNGTRVKTREYQGAARLHTRTVEETARDEAGARANADAADKGKMTKNS